jgi:hypothetical protein
MNSIKKICYWQQGGGDGNRNYIDICIDFAVILNGPGYAGPLDNNTIDTMLKDGVSKNAIADRKRFCFDMSDGDIVALKIGLQKIYAVGVIVGEYEWSDLFSDVDGWDIQHVRRVEWLWVAPKDADGNFTPKDFKKNVLKLGTTLKLDNPDVIKWIDSLKIDFNITHTVPDLPPHNEEKSKVQIEEIAEYLFSKGTSSNSIESLVSVIDDLQMIAKWYKSVDNVSEFETETYLIIPLLRALGWTPQKMAVEWNNVDIAIFNRLPRTADTLIAVVEAKKKGNSCLRAYSQAYNYAKDKVNCNRLIVSDGLRYGVFIKIDDKYILHAYMNITDFRRNYAIYGCEGIQEALWAMTPDWNIDS